MPQFEVVLEELTSVRAGVTGRMLLGYRNAQPNANHQVLALFGARGAALVTVNFDQCLERALRDVGAAPHAMAADADCAGHKARQGVSVPLLKLHGCISRPATIIASVRDLARRGAGTTAALLSPARNRLLGEMLEGRICFCVGYSGRDVLDVIPALRATTRSTIVFARHSSSADDNLQRKLVRILEHPRESSKRRSWHDVVLRVGDTTRFLSGLARQCRIPAPRAPRLPTSRLGPVAPIRVALRTFKPEEALLALARLCLASGNATDALALLDAASSHRIPGNVRFEIELNRIRLRHSGADEVRELRRLWQRLRASGRRRTRAAVAYFIADALDSQAKYDEALHEVQRTLRLLRGARDRKLAVEAKVLRAHILARQGRHGDSLAAFDEVYPSLKARGDALSLATLYTDVGAIQAHRGDYATASKLLQRSLRYWSFAGRPQEALSASVNRANMLFHTGRIREARRALDAILVATRADAKARAYAYLLRGHDRCLRLGDFGHGLADLAESLKWAMAPEGEPHLLPEAIGICRQCVRASSRVPLGRRPGDLQMVSRLVTKRMRESRRIWKGVQSHHGLKEN